MSLSKYIPTFLQGTTFDAGRINSELKKIRAAIDGLYGVQLTCAFTQANTNTTFTTGLGRAVTQALAVQPKIGVEVEFVSSTTNQVTLKCSDIDTLEVLVR